MRRRYPRSDNAVRVPENIIENKGKERKKFYLIRKKGKLRLVRDYLTDYTENSNLHGLKYIGQKERTPVEKIFWLLMFICCVVGCSILIRKVWMKWNESPVIVTLAEKSTPVWQIPYPAITVCSQTKAVKTRFNYTKYSELYERYPAHGNLSEEEIHMFEDISTICQGVIKSSKGRKFSDGKITIENIKQVAPTIEDIFGVCVWQRSIDINCVDLFSPILTEEGLCYTFNTLAAEELFRKENLHSEYDYLESKNLTQAWTVEGGYQPSTPLETYPARGISSGLESGLAIMLRSEEYNLDYRCKGPAQGFKIMLHSPAELPRLSQHFFRLPLSQEVVVAVKPKMMTTSEGLKSYDPERRQCYFQNERYLTYFKVYTQTNCKLECLTNFTYAVCGCVHFGMPRRSNMTVCNRGSMDCLQRAQIELVTIEIQSKIEIPTDNDTLPEDKYESYYTNYSLTDRRSLAEQCHCLPACTSLEYEAETSQDDYNWKAVFESYDLHSITTQYSRVRIYFKEEQFITYRRSELYGLTDFLANCGGLLGLFMGFSILSVAEILYFITLRLCCVLRNHRITKAKQ